MNFAVMYNKTDVIWVNREDVTYHEGIGFTLYKLARSESHADKLVEECCYLPI